MRVCSNLHRALRSLLLSLCGLLFLTGFAASVRADPQLIDFDIEPCNLAGGLHSTGEVELSAPALKDTVIQITNRNPAAIVPATVTVPKGETEAEFDVITLPVTQKVLGSLYGTLNGVSVWMSLTVRPVTVANFTVASNYLCEGSGTTATLTLETAEPYATVVALQSDTPGVVGVPASVTIPAGAIGAQLSLSCEAVSANTRVILTATANGMSRTTTLTVRPMRIQAFALSTNSIVGGNALLGMITLEGPAPAGGKVVALAANAVCVGVPASALVPAGQTTVQFSVSTAHVTTNTSVLIQASVPTMNAYTGLTVRAR